MRVGIGYDVHRFAEGRRLVLGGETISHPVGLEGHSDPGVGIQAVCDAVLGALGLGDIGEHFPNTDPRYKDINSLRLLETVAAQMSARGYGVVNLDLTVLAEQPNLKHVKKAMAHHIAGALGVSDDRVNIKATTHEGMGSVGRGEGIACCACVLLDTAERG